MSAEKRSLLMSKVRGKDTCIEISLRSQLHQRGYRFRKNYKVLPGKPDVVFISEKVAVFVEGDFWHGYRFPTWSNRLSPFWKNKIEANRKRDLKNFTKLRRKGWTVVRIWEHEIEEDLDRCVMEVIESVEAKRLNFKKSNHPRSFFEDALQK